MQYVLDFDEVIFNTSALKEKMDELGIPESERGLSVFSRIAEADPEFNFASLVFPGAQEFIEAHGPHISIVSSAFSIDPENNTNLEEQLAFQREKIRLAGMGEHIAPQNIHVVGAEKSEALHALQQQFGEKLVFVDDREKYVREASELGVRSVWMDRGQRGYLENQEGIPSMLAFPRVGSFKEFQELVSSWEEEQR